MPKLKGGEVRCIAIAQELHLQHREEVRKTESHKKIRGNGKNQGESQSVKRGRQKHH